MIREKNIKNKRILLVDDQFIFRTGLLTLLKEIPYVSCVREVKDHQDVIKHMKKSEFDILLLGLNTPSRKGIQALDDIQILKKKPKIIILTHLTDHHHVDSVLKKGIDGYLLKDASFEEIEIAFQKIMNGGFYCSPLIAEMLLNRFVREPELPENELYRKALSQREKEILLLISDNFSNAEIAHSLNISIYTVKRHRQNLMEKTSSSTVRELIVYAIKNGIKKI